MSTYLTTAPVVVLDEQSVDETAGIVWLGGLNARTTIILQSTGTTSSGVVTIEEAWYPTPDDPYTGTWSALTTVAASTFSGGAQVAVHVVNYSIWALRIRISTVIGGGGTVSAIVWAN